MIDNACLISQHREGSRTHKVCGHAGDNGLKSKENITQPPPGQQREKQQVPSTEHSVVHLLPSRAGYTN